MFEKILIANRGEIACRIIRTCRRLGVRTVAVFSVADADALHVRQADEAYPIGPPPAAQSYLRGETLIEVAGKAGAQAIHPGYGFLSENAGFAEACQAAGMTFIGPPPAAIRAMGSKSTAKALMEEAGVPVVPGYHGQDQEGEGLRREAEGIGYPVLLKASAGGGGKGMRRVDTPAAFDDALEGARREAQKAFGDTRMLVEKYLEQPRHIEVQVFADAQGGTIHLFERECSIQRRHQKVIEEAPAPHLSDALRAELGRAAVDAARAIGYVNAGTVEFIMGPDQHFYFMEMNTRLQVEHPVTELITGLDLVEWQLRVAAGEPLPLTQEEVTQQGHAIEARIYAEDPEREFLPATGQLQHLKWPVSPGENRHIRIDTGVRQGDAISIHYDPMIAKLCVHDRDRAAAVRRLRGALDRLEIAGLTTNVSFLRRVAAHGAFEEGRVDTTFVPRYQAELVPPAQPPSAEELAFATLHVLSQHLQQAEGMAVGSPEPHSPWYRLAGFRVASTARETLRFHTETGEHPVAIEYLRQGDEVAGFQLQLSDGTHHARLLSQCGPTLRIALDGERLSAGVAGTGDRLTVFRPGRTATLSLHDPLADLEHAEGAVDTKLTAPMPGVVVKVLVEAETRVERGDPLMVLEAMKMEHTLTAPVTGKVEAVHAATGEQVDEATILIELAPDEEG